MRGRHERAPHRKLVSQNTTGPSAEMYCGYYPTSVVRKSVPQTIGVSASYIVEQILIPVSN